MRISEHFTLEEMIRSGTAEELNISNVPSALEINNLGILAKSVLEPLRGMVGKPIKVYSGFRSPDLNKAVGGSANSQHIKGEAADIAVDGMSVDDLMAVIVNQTVFSYGQAILEKLSGRNWIHISIGAKKQNLCATNESGKTVYKEYA
jgi:zinc D-Ala-D-Ala carboxypeptidase